MKRSSIFKKTFWYSFFIMSLVILIAHAVIWFIVPQISIVGDTAISSTGHMIDSEVDMVALLKAPLLEGLCISFVCCITIVLILSYLWARTTVKPIKYMAAITRQMADLEPDIQCRINTNDEFENLSENINELYHKLFFTIEQLKEQIKKVDESDQLKIDFLRAASHELKTPLTACNAMLENMNLKVGKYKNYEIYLPECKAMIDKMGLMVQNILDTSKLRNRSENIPKDKIELKKLVDEVSKPFELIAKAKQINFIVNIKQDCELSIEVELFKRALSNVIMNAVLYTDPGKDVEIICDNTKIMISNEGRLIEGEELKKVFEPFFRMENNPGGNGLGLYIVETIFTTLGIKFTFSKNKHRAVMEFIIYLDNHILQ